MPTRQSTAEWRGTLTEGKGHLRSQSGAVDAPYSFKSRAGDGRGTNPEELIGAAHAGCHAMALSMLLSEQGLNPACIETTARVRLEKTDQGFTITRIDLTCEGEVSGLNAEQFREYAETAKRDCPVSRALAGTQIEIQANLRTSKSSESSSESASMASSHTGGGCLAG